VTVDLGKKLVNCELDNGNHKTEDGRRKNFNWETLNAGFTALFCIFVNE
jgi:hypothetical protein